MTRRKTCQVLSLLTRDFLKRRSFITLSTQTLFEPSLEGSPLRGIVFIPPQKRIAPEEMLVQQRPGEVCVPHPPDLLLGRDDVPPRVLRPGAALLDEGLDAIQPAHTPYP